MILLAKFNEFSFEFKLELVPNHNWVLDEEHGLVHGYFVAFFACLMCSNQEEKLIRSCLLHDYLRCAGEEPHDQKMRLLNLDLDEAVYSHSNPQDENHPLVLADRIELLRYKDWECWVNKNMLPKDLDIKDLVNFYERRNELIPDIRKKWGRYTSLSG